MSSTFRMILFMVSITISGYSPTDVSPLSITASAPSKTEFATSFTSARVGRGEVIILSSICVATITGLEAARHFLAIIFCNNGTCSIGISTPRSPLATITPSVASIISSILSTASGFSILAITLAVLSLLAIILFSSIISSAERTNESPIHSTSLLNAKSRFAKSSSVKLGIETFVFGRLTPLREVRIPP